MYGPWIIGSRDPGVAFRILYAEFAAAIRRVLQRTNDLGSSSHGARMGGIGIWHHDVNAAGLKAPELVRRLEAAPKFIVLAGSEHDHSATQSEFGMTDGSVRTLVDSAPFKAKHLCEPVDSPWCVAVAKTGDDRAAGFSHENLRRQASREMGRETINSGMLAGMSLPAGDRELVQIVDASLADAARRAGPWLVCRPGCTQCCFGAFAISQLDALRLASGMRKLRSENPALASEVERRAFTWIGKHGPAFPGDVETGRIGGTESDRERFEEFANEAACPALDPDTGWCDVYEWRPMTCRVFGPPVRMGAGDALGHCELCFNGATTDQVAACEMAMPHDLEQQLIDQVPTKGETLVAFALIR